MTGSRGTRSTLLAALAAMAGAVGAGAQSNGAVHPTKEAFARVDSWPAVAPGDEPIDHFQPFRAVYERVYRDATGNRQDDRVIITAERVAWGATPAILVTLIDTGNMDSEATTARIQTRIFAADDQELLLQIAPAPGTAKDYLVVHPQPDGVVVTGVSGDTGEASRQVVPVTTPQLGAPAMWIIGAMDLEDGQGLRFAPADAPSPSNILGARPFLVSGRETVPVPDGTRDAWVVRYPLGMDGPRVMENLLSSRPPYLLGKRPLDLETGETSDIGTLRLIEFVSFQDR